MKSTPYFGTGLRHDVRLEVNIAPARRGWSRGDSLRSMPVLTDADLADGSIEVGALVGAWRTIGTIEPGQTLTKDGVHITLDEEIEDLGALHRLKGKYTVTDPAESVHIFPYSPEGAEVGETHRWANSPLFSRPPDGPREFKYTLHLGQAPVVHYVVKARKREWVTFENVAAQPVWPEAAE